MRAARRSRSALQGEGVAIACRGEQAGTPAPPASLPAALTVTPPPRTRSLLAARRTSWRRRLCASPLSPTMASDLIAAGLRQLLAVLAQAPHDVPAAGFDLSAELLHVTLAGLLPRLCLGLHLLQMFLTRGGQLGGVLLEAVPESAASRFDVGAELLDLLTARSAPTFSMRRNRRDTQRRGERHDQHNHCLHSHCHPPGHCFALGQCDGSWWRKVKGSNAISALAIPTVRLGFDSIPSHHVH